MTRTAEHLRVIDGELGTPATAPPPDPLVGATIDARYRIEGVLGEGGMGLVYRAKHVVLGKPLAVKVLRPEVSRDQEIMTRFRQEAQSATAIGNQHIVDVSDFGTLPDGSTYFVMEYLEGTSLTGAIEDARPMPPSRTLHIAKQLCRALGAAHDAGIVHRDMKPDNVFLVKRGSDADFVKVLDFGIAKVGSGGSNRLTKAGQVFGTPHYMSPEQCAGSNVDHRTDMYALGIILYEMASGRVPFDADNLMGILTKHMYESPIPPRELSPPVDVPPGLEAIILKCLAKNRDDRYATMLEMLADLEKLEQGATPAAVLDRVERSSRNAREPTGRSGLSIGIGDIDTQAPSSPRMKTIAVAGIAAALLLVGGGVAMWPGAEAPTAARPRPAAADAPVPAPSPPVAAPTAELEPAAQAPAPAPPASIRLDSEPAGAEVFRGGVLVGNTPLDLSKPEGDERVEIELRHPEYESESVRLSRHTSSEVRVTLERSRTRPSRGRPSNTRPEPEREAQAPTKRAPHRSEVLDPWAN